MTTKFNIGQEVYFLTQFGITRKPVEAMLIRGDGYQNSLFFDSPSPNFGKDKGINESKCFATKAELIATL